MTFLASAGKMYFVEPILQVQIVGDAAQQRHGGVGVGIDQTRHQDGVGAIQTVAGLKLLFDIRALADADDAFATDRDGAIVDEAMLRVHGDDVTRGVDPVGGLGVGK